MSDTPKMIAIDMDGTLVHPGGTVSPGNQDALDRARRAGARIVIATGRRHSYAMKVLQTGNFQPDDIVLSSNGAVARTMDGRLLFREEMPAETALWLCETVNDYRNCLVFTFDTMDAHGDVAGGALVLEEVDDLHASIEKWMVANAADIRRIAPIESAFHAADFPAIQAMLCGSMERMEGAFRHLDAAHEGRLSLTRTVYPLRDLCILDILPKGCSKGAGLAHLLREEGLVARDLMAIGDNWNDLTMLEHAHWPMLMGNAPDDLRLLAKERNWTVTRHHHEDGVAEAIALCFSGR
jgi:Cof subfamily protein (haloacid dehalogenase superfamily)